MPQVIERWLTPVPHSKPDKDVVHLNDDTYCWAEHNTNNFEPSTYLLLDLINDPLLDPTLLDVIQNGGPADIIGPTLIGQPAQVASFYDDAEIAEEVECEGCVVGCDICRNNNTVVAQPRRPSINEPRNNDGRTDCYKCRQPVVLSGGGMYQLCGNQSCEWHGN